MTMLEKMARAACRAEYLRLPQYSAPGFESLLDHSVDAAWPSYVGVVKAALQAIREPDEATVEAGWADAHEEDARATFTAMIDHILNEGQP